LKQPNALLLCLLLICGCLLTAPAQQRLLYQPQKDDSAYLAQLKVAIRKQFETDSSGLAGENKKYLQKFYRERYDAIRQMFTDGELVGLPQVNAYYNQLTQHILSSNPQLKLPPIRFVLNRAYWPNAACYGEGTIVFNAGLFTKLQNEAQVAFVLCHELAHQYFNHGNHAIHQYVNTVYGNEFQQKLKDINKLEFEKNKAADKLLKPMVFSTRRHGREHESQADSLALLLMVKAGFDGQEAINSLQMLDDIDENDFITKTELPVVFNHPNFPFKPRWLHQEETFFGISDASQLKDAESDSIKTHPDCKQRALRLVPALAHTPTNASKKFYSDTAMFAATQELLRYEMVAHCFKSKNISRCLYQALAMQSSRKQDAFLAATIGHCMAVIFQQQKAHTLSQIIEFPSPAREKNYNLLLEFLQKLTLSEIASLCYYFLQAGEKDFATHEDFVYALVKSKEIFEKPEEKKHWIEHYHKTFNKPKYKF
jgi:Zn-dependent protease with chaperone function